MKTRIPIYLVLALALAAGGCSSGKTVPLVKRVPAQKYSYSVKSEADRIRAYQARVDSVITFYAERTPADDYSSGGVYEIAARMARKSEPDWVKARLDSVLTDQVRGDMFWMFPVTTMLFVGKDQMAESQRAQFRDLWRTYMPYRGDTENHFVLYYSSLYLMNELYPDDPPESWYTGKSSAENRAEAKGFLLEWMDLTTTIGQGEYDSPHYLKVYIAPMAMLYAFAKDPEMKQRAQMMLDYIIADFAVESLHGLYGGAHSRVYPQEADQPWVTPAARFGWMLFGNTPAQMSGESFILAVSGYVPPGIIYDMATDRSTPYTHRETKRTRHRIRHSDVKNLTVYKESRVRDEYILGSSQGGLLQPIQQQTWSLIWKEDDPRGIHNNFSALHPYSGALEGTMYFAEHWDMVTELIVRSKTTYNAPDKFTGGSPYEQVYQHDDALVALYDIPQDDDNPHLNGFFSKDLKNVTEDPSGWIFASGGPSYIAFYPLQPYEWLPVDNGNRRWYSPHVKNGYVVQVAAESDFDSWSSFVNAVKALPISRKTSPTPSVQFTTLSGNQIDVTYGAAPKLDGKTVNYNQWKLFDGPFLQADMNSRILEMRFGERRRTLDFNTLSITDWVKN